jgi:hypothetical protein
MTEFTQEKADKVLNDIVDGLFINNPPDKQSPYWNKDYFWFFSDWRSKNPNPTKVEVWNFLKKMVDLAKVTHQHAYIQIFLDLEGLGMDAPEGGYSQADGSINNAPWRQPDGPWHN